VTNHSEGRPPASGQQTKAVGGFEVLSKIGQGAMGAVFKARQVSVDRIVALKILPRRLARDPQFVQRFLREARSAARLNHTNIVQAIDAGQAAGYHYFAMEFVDGQSLADRLAEHGRLPEQKALAVIRDVLSGLACAHRAGIIHRDVKPDNILITSAGVAKLADLGLARENLAARSDLTGTGVALGTPNYISPEQVRGDDQIDGRADLYSVGAMLFHLLTGQPPFVGTTSAVVMSQHLTEPIPDPRSLNPAVSYETAMLIRKAMAKDRNHRQASAEEFLNDVNALLSRPAASADGSSTPPPLAVVGTAASAAATTPSAGGTSLPRAAAARPPGRSKAALFAAAAVTLLLALGGGAYAILSIGATDEPGRGPSTDTPLAAALEWADEHPDQVEAAILRIDEALAASADAAEKETARQRLDKLRERQRAAASKAFDKHRDRARQLAEQGDFDGALRLLQAVPASAADALGGRVEDEIAAIRRKADQTVDAVLRRAAAALAEDAPARAVKTMESLRTIRHAPAQSRINATWARVTAAVAEEDQRRRRQRETARKAFDHLLHAFEDSVLKGDLAAARRRLSEATKDPDLDPVRTDVRTLTSISETLSRLARDPDQRFVPTSANEALGLALHALARRDAPLMADALDRAKDHPLHDRYTDRLALLKESLSGTTDPADPGLEDPLQAVRKKVVARLHDRKFDAALALLNERIADSEHKPIRNELEADRLPVKTLAALLDRVRANVRSHVGKPAHYHGIPATIKSFDGNKVTFDRGTPEAIEEMRAVDIRNLANLNPGDRKPHHEAMALLFLCDGEADRAKPHLAAAGETDDIRRLRAILGAAGAEIAARPDPDPPPDVDDDSLAPEQVQALRAALARNKELYEQYKEEIADRLDAAQRRYRDRVRWEWNDVCDDLRREHDDYRNARRYYDDFPASSRLQEYARERLRDAERDYRAARERKEAVARQIKSKLNGYTRKAQAVVSKLRLLYQRNQRVILIHKQVITEADLVRGYEGIVGDGPE
jgi:serine/threonine-protein kinase